MKNSIPLYHMSSYGPRPLFGNRLERSLARSEHRDERPDQVQKSTKTRKPWKLRPQWGLQCKLARDRFWVLYF